MGVCLAVSVAPRQQLQPAEPVSLAMHCMLQMCALDQSSTNGKHTAKKGYQESKYHAHPHHTKWWLLIKLNKMQPPYLLLNSLLQLADTDVSGSN